MLVVKAFSAFDGLKRDSCRVEGTSAKGLLVSSKPLFDILAA
jgi:hypothetical protein